MNKIITKTLPSVINPIDEDADISHLFGNWRAYYDMTKPKVVALLVLTALVGMSLSVPGGLPWWYSSCTFGTSARNCVK